MVLLETRRFFRRNVKLALSGVCVLGIGLGASALVFTCLLALTSSTMPGMRAMAYATIAETVQGGGSERITWSRFEHLQASQGSNLRLAAYSPALTLSANVSGRDVDVRIASVSHGFWGVFTPGLAAGRDFYGSEETSCQPRVLILSYKSAERIFSSPSSAIGQAMRINGKAYEIVGVGPPLFAGIFDQPVDGWAPPACLLSLNSLDGPAAQENPQIWRRIAWFYTIAGWQTGSVADLINRVEKSLPDTKTGETPLHVSVGLTLDPVRQEWLLRWLRLGFLVAAAFTMMSGMNYAILLLTRMPSQIYDVDLKKALGASSRRILIELTIGPSVMVAVGVLAAWAICFGGLASLAHFFPEAGNIVSDAWTHAPTACVAMTLFSILLTGLIALLPALRVLRNGGRGLTSRHTATARGSDVLLLDAIVTIQIVLCMMVAVIAGTLASSILHVLGTSLGFETANLSIISLGPRDTNSLSVVIDTTKSDRSSYPSPTAIRGVLHQLESLPGASYVGYSEDVPLGDPPASASVQLVDGASNRYTVATTIVSQGFFDAMGIQLLGGRVFPRSELAAPNQAVISRSLARELSPLGYPLQKTIRITHPAASGMEGFAELATVVGVVEDVKQSGPASSSEPTIYQCAFGTHFFHSAPYFALRGIESRNMPRVDIARNVAKLIPGIQVQDIFSLRDRVRASMIPEEERVSGILFLALLISSLTFLGLGASLTFYVVSRRRDLAVRICFGATAWRIRALVIRRAAACGGAAALLSMLTWPFLARLSSQIHLGTAAWSYERAAFSSIVCLLFVILISLLPANAATQTSASELLKDY
jgi:hypothetical protein